MTSTLVPSSLRWRQNGRDSVSNHQPHDCLLNRLFRRRSKQISKLCVTGLCAENSPGAGEFPAHMASYAEKVSIWSSSSSSCTFVPAAAAAAAGGRTQRTQELGWLLSDHKLLIRWAKPHGCNIDVLLKTLGKASTYYKYAYIKPMSLSI